MLVAALLDLGVPLEAIQDGLSKVDLEGYGLEVLKASRSGALF